MNITQRYMFIKCRICSASYINDSHCHMCGSITIEKADGTIAIGRIRSDGTWLAMAKPINGLYGTIMRVAQRFGR